MASTESQELASLDRVLTRLALTEEDKLEKVRSGDQRCCRVSSWPCFGTCRVLDLRQLDDGCIFFGARARLVVLVSDASAVP